MNGDEYLMDVKTYLKNKMIQKNLLPSFKKEHLCLKCFRSQENCLCFLIKSFDTKIHFVLLMHPMEAKKEKTGTGRLALACLKNSTMISGVDFTNDQMVNDLINDHNNYCMILYPGARSLNISSDDISSLVNLNQQRWVVFIIDGTWPCAKKMMKLSTNLHPLPRVSFTTQKESLFLIKEQPAKFCLSTIESIHFFLSECERRGLEKLNSHQDNMIEVFKAMVDFQIKCATNPNLPSYRKKASGYSLKEERVKSKKWGSNRIIFKG